MKREWVLLLIVGLLAIQTGCLTKGSKLIRDREAIRAALQDIDRVLQGYVRLYADREILVTRDRVEVWIKAERPPRTPAELQFISDRICQHVLDTLDGMDINAAADKVTIVVRVVNPLAPPQASGEPAEYGTSTYDPANDQINFAATGP